MNLIEISVLNKITENINPLYFETADMRVKENNENSSYNSIVIDTSPTVYRQSSPSEVLFCRVKTKGKTSYISFPPTKKAEIDKLGIEYITTNSDDFLRIDIDKFLNLTENENFSSVMHDLFLKSFSFPKFSCCSRYKECSEQGKCVHPDLIYATACDYKKNLDTGRNFYKK